MQLVALFLALVAAPPSQQDQVAPARTAPKISVAAIDAAIERGSNWLRARQREDGEFAPAAVPAACGVALTAMATWSLAQPAPVGIDAAAAQRAMHALLQHQQSDGGIYDPARGLAVYTSGVSSCALASLGTLVDRAQYAGPLAAAQLFTYTRRAPESIVDATPEGHVAVGSAPGLARELLSSDAVKDASERRALEFLSRTRPDAARTPARVRTLTPEAATAAGRKDGQIGPFTYDDLLPLVYVELAPNQQLAMRVRAALGAYYTPERNPDLTKRYGAAGFAPGSQGLYFYYYVAAKALTVFGEHELVTADGQRHAWAHELALRLVRSQRDDGAWVNTDTAWWESEPVLASSYALLTLKLCRASVLASAK